MTLGKRIERALTHWGGGHRAFARQMQKREIRGGTYRSLVNYKNDATVPSMKWIEEAATILEVSAEWLGTEKGSMVPQDLGEEIVRENRPHRENPWLGKLLRTDLDRVGFEDCTPDEHAWLTDQAGTLVLASFQEAEKTVWQSCSDFENATWDDRRAISRWLIRTALEPFVCTNPEPSSMGTRREFNGAFNLMFQALANAAPNTRQGKTVADLVRSLTETEED